MAMMPAGSPDDQLEWLQKLRAREMDTLVKENADLRAELQRLRAQMPQVKSLEEKLQRHEGLEQQLQNRVDELQAHLDHAEKGQEHALAQVQGLEEQLRAAKEKEVELQHLRERATKTEAERNALNMKVVELTAIREEAKGQLIRSDKVCSELLEKIKDRTAALELAKLEVKELQAAERSNKEAQQRQVQELNAEISQLNKECQQLRHQESETSKVMEERLKGKDQQLQTQEVEVQRSSRAAEDAKAECQRRVSQSRDEVQSLQEKLEEKVRSEHQLKEKVCILESQVQQHQAEAARLRQDVLRLQTLADEREITVEKVQKREDSSSEKASEMQKKLHDTQSALLTERGRLQETEVELYRARESLSSARKEADEVKRHEEAARRDAIRRSDEKLAQELTHTQQLLASRVTRAEEKVAERDAEILRLDRELAQVRGHLAMREREASQLAMELRGASSREGALEHELEQASRHRTQGPAAYPSRLSPRGDFGAFTEPHRLRLGRQVDSVPPRREPAPERYGFGREPRTVARPTEPVATADADGLMEPLAQRIHRDLLPQETVSPPAELEQTWRPDEDREEPAPLWEAEPPEALSPQRASLDYRRPAEELELHQALRTLDVSPKAEPLHLQLNTEEEDSILQFQGRLDLWMRRRLMRLEERQLILEVWHAWSCTAKVSALRARLELVLTDELRLAKVREEAKLDLKHYFAEQLRSSGHWPEGTGPAQADPPMEGFSFENKLASLKSFIYEFRQRVAESVAELPGASQAAHGLEGSEVLVKTLELGRGAFGRLLHAALFLYQKLRTLVPTELEVTMRDPLSRLVPVPFYVLPYKVPPKVRLAVQEVGSQRTIGGLARSLARGGNGAQGRGQLEELQDLMPLCASDRTAIPGFLAQLLRIRSVAPVPMGDLSPDGRKGAGYRDGLDQLVVDALTVYMSGWRLSRSAGEESHEAANVPREPVAQGGPQGGPQGQGFQGPRAHEGSTRDAPRGPISREGKSTQGESSGLKLRLGPDRALST